jgi:YD repeat-containing protein
VNADTHPHSTASGQESATSKRPEGETLPFTRSKRGRLTARELARRRRQRLLELLQQHAQPPASQ